MKLNYKRTFFIGLAFMSIGAFWQLYDTIIPLILSKTFQLDETMTGGIMALDNILALFLLPLFGTFSDRTQTKLGKRTPFIIIGTITSVIIMSFLPYADQKENFILFVVALGLVLLTMGTYRSPAVALMPDLTPKPLRSKANSIINLMGALGAIFSLVLIKILVKKEAKPDYTYVFLCVSAFMIFAVIILILTIHENKLAKEDNNLQFISKHDEEAKAEPQVKEIMPKEVQRSLIFILLSIFLWFTAYNAVTSAFSRYAVKVWKLEGGDFTVPLLVATGGAILSYIPIGIISSHIGRKKTIILGIIMMTLSYATCAFFTSYTPIINIIFALTGIGWAAISVNSLPMVVEMSRRSDVGKYTGIYYAFSMSAQIFTPIFSGVLLQNVSYRTLFPYAVVFSLLSLCTMLCVKHGDSKPPKKGSVIENFDIDD